MVAGEGRSKFIILYHRTPFDEGKDEKGQRIWIDQKSPNGIIPTLRNLFRSSENGTWIAWRRVESLESADDETIAMAEPAPCCPLLLTVMSTADIKKITTLSFTSEPMP